MSTLINLLSELRLLLDDNGTQSWSDESLAALLRLALARLQVVCPFKLQVAGLDDALLTSLDEHAPALLLRLARLEAERMRWQQRQESYHPDPTRQQSPAQFLEVEQHAVEQALEAMRRSFMQHSSQPPYCRWRLPEDSDLLL